MMNGLICHINRIPLSFENLCVNFQYRSNKYLEIKKKEILLQSR